MKPITVREAVINATNHVNTTYTYEDILDIWGEDSDELVVQLANQCNQLEGINAELLAALKKLTNSTTLSCTKHYADMRIDRDHLKEAGTAIAKAEVTDEPMP